ncbi:MAG: gliding motility lipoprotein GldD [Bacteroidetes bacterium]|nr:gliding motility lipoprotein GldD [Bacteroidota bacterium]
MNNYLKIMICLVLVSCGSEEAEYIPKPFGYMRVEFPDRVYSIYDSGCPYTFEMPEYFSVIDKDSFCNMKDIFMERFNATLNLTYLPVDTNLNFLIERSRQFVYEHSQFADGIEEEVILNKANQTYGLRYNISGDAASPFQFYLTDSTTHFMRGALYFNVKPNYDSIRPSLDYIREDLDRMLNTLIWKPDTLK